MFRNLPVTSIDDGVFTASGGIYVNYVISGDVVYEIDVRNAAVRAGSVLVSSVLNISYGSGLAIN